MGNVLGRVGGFLCCIAIALSGTVVAQDSERTFLTIGQAYGGTSLPLKQINGDTSLPFRVSARYFARPESFPNVLPLPDMPNGLPDVVSAFVAYRHNELVALARNGAIEPLDDLFEEVGVDPREFLLPNAYDAVRFDGHIWALPHRMQFFLMSFDESMFNTLGLPTRIDSWQAFRDAAEAVAGAGPEPRHGVTSGQLSAYDMTTLLLHFLERDGIRADEIVEFHGHMVQLASTGILDGPTWATRNAISLETFRTPESRRLVVPLPPSNALTEPVGTEEAARLGFMEVFALRVNSDEKREGARRFLKWLMRTETQMRLMRGSSLDMPKRSRQFSNCHLTLYRPALNSDAFKRWCEEHPAYIELARAALEVHLTTASQSLDRDVLDGKYRALCDEVWDTAGLEDLVVALHRFMGAPQASDLEPDPDRDLSVAVLDPSVAERSTAGSGSSALAQRGDGFAEEGDHEEAAIAWLNAWIQSPESGDAFFPRLYGAWLKDGDWMAPVLFGGDALSDAALNPLKTRILARIRALSESNGMDDRLRAIGEALDRGDLEHLCATLESVVEREMLEGVSEQDRTEFFLSLFLLGGSGDAGFPWPEDLSFASENRFHAVRRRALELSMGSFDTLALDMQAFYALRIAERFMDDIQVQFAVDVLENRWRNPNTSKRWRERLFTRYAALLADECARPEQAADAYAGYCDWHRDAPSAFRTQADSLYSRPQKPAR
ncbi:MAG: extracellular solute-binding protein [bacterium]|nr:extracellular solute-binding protein [bacterium]